MNAATSGAFVLSESYLYTTEMIEESLRHLTDGASSARSSASSTSTRSRIARPATSRRRARRSPSGHSGFSEPRHDRRARPGFRRSSSSPYCSARAAFSSEQIGSVHRTEAAQLTGGVVRYVPGRRRRPDSGQSASSRCPTRSSRLSSSGTPTRWVRSSTTRRSSGTSRGSRTRWPLPCRAPVIDHEDSIAEQVTAGVPRRRRRCSPRSCSFALLAIRSRLERDAAQGGLGRLFRAPSASASCSSRWRSSRS